MTDERLVALTQGIVTRWRDADARPRSGVTADQFRAFEARVGVSLPRELVALYEIADGMEEEDWDEHHIRFWPLESLQRLEDALPAGGGPGGYFVFADFLLWSHAYAVRLAPAGASDVVLVGGAAPTPLASSFGEFLEMYLHRPRSLF